MPSRSVVSDSVTPWTVSLYFVTSLLESVGGFLLAWVRAIVASKICSSWPCPTSQALQAPWAGSLIVSYSYTLLRIPKSFIYEGYIYWYLLLEKTLESPLDCREIKLVNPKGIHPEYSLEGLVLKLQYFGHPMRKADSLEKTLMLAGRIEGRRRGWLNGHEFEWTPGNSEG